ncbi:UvrD-helicase domain-containing protein [Clavibacter tessellarius]|uniref:UvrD-helicase domain-containing protein n=1 Tax=Clavibacter tessellarius TaxID=31965 RepID=UPI003250B95E
MSGRINSPDTELDQRLRELLDRPTPPSFMVTAGAGSGKTTSLVKALAHLDATRGSVLSRTNQRIACITYTVVAAAEIREEINRNPLFHISTIHSFLWTLVRPFMRDVQTWVASRIDAKVADYREHNAKPGTREATRQKNNIEIESLLADKVAVHDVTHFTYGTGSRYGSGILGHDDIIKMVPEFILEKPLLRQLVGQQYPFIFVDESQDTAPAVVDALKAIAADESSPTCLGFFGDPMQQIYATGSGSIPMEPGWESIPKPENFRCPTAVLNVINSIRQDADEALVQIGGRRDPVNGGHIKGSASLFVLSSEGDRDLQLREVRSWLAIATGEPEWERDDADGGVRVLVIEHRLAARRLGFENIFEAHHDKSTDSLKAAFPEGTAWPVLPFVTYLVPLAAAVADDAKYAQMHLVRTYGPDVGVTNSTKPVPEHLASLAAAVVQHAHLMQGAGTTVGDVLKHALAEGLWVPDGHYAPYASMIAGMSPRSLPMKLSRAC